jgi:hypothetical protein
VKAFPEGERCVIERENAKEEPQNMQLLSSASFACGKGGIYHYNSPYFSRDLSSCRHIYNEWRRQIDYFHKAQHALLMLQNLNED